MSIFFAVFIACALVIDRSGLAGLGLLCILIHECGHIFAIRIMNIKVERVEFRLFGINIALKNGTSISYRQEILLSLSGCAANFAACIPAYILYVCGIAARFSGTIFIFNLFLACFNILPVISLDGGRAFESFLCLKTSCQKAETVVNITSVIFIIPTAAIGFYLVMKTGYNISLVVASVYLFVALVIKSGKKMACR
ncbi:MAG TPA: site-2 protease family protein [Ruminiclostridium sp.]|nr:site-2 protease family protein [Ruminiclostridium sp.]